MFSSFRRHYLDRELALLPFSGDVLDVGGKKMNPKGEFRPPMERCRSWKTVNIDASTSPDYLHSAESLPLPDSSVDTVLLAETLEHLKDPDAALREAHRVLRPGGALFLTMPFLYAVHGDPFDFQRWTPDKFRGSLPRCGFADIQVRPMGGLIGAIFDQLEAYCQLHYCSGRKPALAFRIVRRLARGPLLATLIRLDSRAAFPDALSGGFVVTARKP